MPRLPKGVDWSALPDLAHYRAQGIDRLRAWCLTPLCFHQAKVTFDELARYGARDTTKLLHVRPRLKCTRCGRQNADLQPDWSQKVDTRPWASTWGAMPPGGGKK